MIGAQDFNEMRSSQKTGGASRMILVLGIVSLLPAFVGLGIWMTGSSGTDGPLLFGILGSLMVPSCAVLVCALGSFISGQRDE